MEQQPELSIQPYLNVKHTDDGVLLEITWQHNTGRNRQIHFWLHDAEKDDLVACLRSEKECRRRAAQQAAIPFSEYSDDVNLFRTVADYGTYREY